MPFVQQNIQDKIKQRCAEDKEFEKIWNMLEVFSAHERLYKSVHPENFEDDIDIDDILYFAKGLVRQKQIYEDE